MACLVSTCGPRKHMPSAAAVWDCVAGLQQGGDLTSQAHKLLYVRSKGRRAWATQGNLAAMQEQPPLLA